MLTFAMQYLLDTNICIAAMRNHPLVVQRMTTQSPGDCAISTITGYELYTGVASGAATLVSQIFCGPCGMAVASSDWTKRPSK